MSECVGRSTAKLGRHVTLGTPGEVGQCDSRNTETHPVERSMQCLHLVERQCLSQSRRVAFPASQAVMSVGGGTGFLGRMFVLGVDKLKLDENRRKGSLYTTEK